MINYVAVKIVSKNAHISIEARTKLAREVSIMKSLDHPLLSELFYFMEDENYFYLVMEYLENGSLLDLINSSHPNSLLLNSTFNNANQNFDRSNINSQLETQETFLPKIPNNNCLYEATVRKFFVQLIVALEFLHHEQHIAHRDIKLENVLLDRYNNIRIIDFGLSAILTDDSESLKTTVGSIAYSAPEILMKRAYSKSADIWSAGVILYTLATSKLPFINLTNEINYSTVENAKYEVLNDPAKICDMILHGNLEIPSNLSENLQDLIRKMLERDPHKRITIKNIIEHPWFSMEQYTKLHEFVENQDKIEDIDFQPDEQIETRLVDSGLEVEMLPQLLFVQEIDEATASYKELRKTKIREELKKIYDDISLSNNQQEQIPQPNQFNSIDQFVNLSCQAANTTPPIHHNQPSVILLNQPNDKLNRENIPSPKKTPSVNYRSQPNRKGDSNITSHASMGSELQLSYDYNQNCRAPLRKNISPSFSFSDKAQQPGSLLLQLQQQKTPKQSYMSHTSAALTNSSDHLEKGFQKSLVRPRIPVKKVDP